MLLQIYIKMSLHNQKKKCKAQCLRKQLYYITMYYIICRMPPMDPSVINRNRSQKETNNNQEMNSMQGQLWQCLCIYIMYLYHTEDLRKSSAVFILVLLKIMIYIKPKFKTQINYKTINMKRVSTIIRVVKSIKMF